MDPQNVQKGEFLDILISWQVSISRKFPFSYIISNRFSHTDHIYIRRYMGGMLVREDEGVIFPSRRNFNMSNLHK